jgi:hypothetical protein
MVFQDRITRMLMTNAPFSETSLAFALSTKAYHQLLCLGHRAEWFFPAYWFAKAAKKRVIDRSQRLRIFSKKLLTIAPWSGIIINCSAR